MTEKKVETETKSKAASKTKVAVNPEIVAIDEELALINVQREEWASYINSLEPAGRTALSHYENFKTRVYQREQAIKAKKMKLKKGGVK